jgi:hypothetical protein
MERASPTDLSFLRGHSGTLAQATFFTLGSVDSTDPVERETVAEFWPPNALQRFNAWEAEHSDLVGALPDDAVRVDVGRAVAGSFARVRIATEHAPRFRKHFDDPPSVVCLRGHSGTLAQASDLASEAGLDVDPQFAELIVNEPAEMAAAR